jgi:hypothetical protein
MRSMRKLGVCCCSAMFALLLSIGPAQAECVSFEGLSHCSTGEAQLSVGEQGLRVGNFGGQNGVGISLEGATSWTASTLLDESSKGRQEALFTAVAEGSVTSTARIGLNEGHLDIAATFTGAGDRSTYSVLVYNDGVLQGSVGGVGSGTVGAKSIGGGPGCRPDGQSYSQCMNTCYTNGWPCGYCVNPCNTVPVRHVGFHAMAIRGECVWDLGEGPSRPWQLANGAVVEGNRIVLIEEVQEGGSYPYLNFDEILLQGTLDSATFASESVVRP